MIRLSDKQIKTGVDVEQLTVEPIHIMPGSPTINDDCSAAPTSVGWTNSNVGNGTVTQTAFDSKECYKFDSGAISSNDRAGIYRTISASDEVNFTAELQMYFDALGAGGDGDYSAIILESGTYRCWIRFDTAGIYIISEDGSTYNKVSGSENFITADTWFTFMFSTIFHARIMEVWVKDENDNWLFLGSFSTGSTTTDNNTRIHIYQYGYTTANRIMYVNYVKVNTSKPNTVYAKWKSLQIGDSKTINQVLLCDGTAESMGGCDYASGGTLTASTWHSLWACYKPDPSDYDCKLLLSKCNPKVYQEPTIPDSDYTEYRFIGWVYSDSSSLIQNTIGHIGRDYQPRKVYGADFSTGDFTLDGSSHFIDVSNLIPPGVNCCSVVIRAKDATAGDLFTLYGSTYSSQYVQVKVQNDGLYDQNQGEIFIGDDKFIKYVGTSGLDYVTLTFVGYKL